MITESIRLRQIAFARSGDKGVNANIAIFAYTDVGYQFLKEKLTEKKVHLYFEALSPEKTVRFELPNLNAFNFVLYNVLDSLRTDSQGKAIGQALLEIELPIPEEKLSLCLR
ncbi:MAG: hypothetical protein WD595_06360 [Waddliaceae bacterium]